MEEVRVDLDDGDGAKFDRELRHVLDANGVRTGDVLKLTTKDRGTESGRPIVFVSFDVQRHGQGEIYRVGFTTTARALLAAADLIRARYGDNF